MGVYKTMFGALHALRALPHTDSVDFDTGAIAEFWPAVTSSLTAHFRALAPDTRTATQPTVPANAVDAFLVNVT